MTQNRAILFEHSTNLKFRLICYNSVIIRYMLSNCTKLHLVTFPSSIIDLHYMYSRFLTQIHKRQPRVLRRVPPDDNAKLVFDYYDLSLRRERERAGQPGSSAGDGGYLVYRHLPLHHCGMCCRCDVNRKQETNEYNQLLFQKGRLSLHKTRCEKQQQQ